MKLKLISIFVIAVLTFSASIKSVFAETVYKKPLPSLPVSFNPKRYIDAYSILIATQIYDRLFDLDEYANIKPHLISKWETEEDGRIWVLRLREDVKFHNGKPLTSKDIEFTLYELLKPDSVRTTDLSIIKGAKDYTAGKSKKIAGIKTLDDYTISIELNEPFQPFLALFTAPNTEILPNNYGGITEEEFYKHPIGTGAFEFVEFPENSVKIKSNKNYFLGFPKLDVVIFEKAPLDEAIQKFNAGYYQDLEFYFDVDPKLISRSYTVIKSISAATNLLVINTRIPPFNNVHFRKALMYAIDKEKLISLCYPNRTIAFGYIPPSIGGYYPDIHKISYNLELAKKEIKLANLNKKTFDSVITILRPDNHSCQKEISQFYRDTFKKLGLNVITKHLPLQEIVNTWLGPRQFQILNWFYTADYPEALFMLNMFRSNNPNNDTGINSPDIEKPLDQASKSADRYERYRLYQKVQEILQVEVPIIPLFYNLYSVIYQHNIKGIPRPPLTVYTTPMRTIYFEDDTFYKK